MHIVTRTHTRPNLDVPFFLPKTASTDEFRTYFLENYIKTGKSVVVSNIFHRLFHVKPYYEIAKKYKVKFKIIKLKNQYGNIHNVPEDILKKIKNDSEEISIKILNRWQKLRKKYARM